MLSQKSAKMSLPFFTASVAVAIALLPVHAQTSQSATQSVSQTNAATDDFADIAVIIEEVRVKHEQPAMAAAVTRGREIVALGVAGSRSARHDVAVEIEEAFHIGSCTKAFTSTLIAKLIEAGKLEWETTIIEVFPDWQGKILADFERVTIEQLLSHRAGVLSFTQPGPEMARVGGGTTGLPREQRLQFVEKLLNEQPTAVPGSDYLYSNAGYAVAAAMAEQVMDDDWQSLIRKYVFEPLELSTAGFGLPGSFDPAKVSNPSKVEPTSPWGHFEGPNGLAPIPPMDRAMLPIILESAGDIQCSVGDLARFVAAHAESLLIDDEDQSEQLFLSHATAIKLHEPILSDYAMGWFDFSFQGNTASAHNGSAGTFFTFMMIDRNTGTGIVVMSNAGNGNDACLELVERLHAAFKAAALIVEDD